MEFHFFIKGLIIGISISAPLGPIGVLCIQKTINKGLKSGVILGFGAVLADTLYAIVAGFGITIISEFLTQYQTILRIAGGALLLVIGIRIFFSNPIKQIRKQRHEKTNHVSDFFQVFGLTLSNPATIVVLGAVFTSLGLVGNSYSITIMISGVFSGAFLWWIILSTIINKFRDKIRLRNLWWINKIAGGLILLLGIVAAISLFFYK